MKKSIDSAHKLSWPSMIDIGGWSITLILAVLLPLLGLVIVIIGGIIFSFMASSMDINTGMSFWCLLPLIGIGVAGGIFLLVMLVGGGGIWKKTRRVKKQREKTKQALGAIVIENVLCVTSETLGVPEDVLLVLTPDIFAIYNQKPFKKCFEASLSQLKEVRVNPIDEMIEITFIEADNEFVGKFRPLTLNWSSEGLVDSINAARRKLAQSS